MSTRPMRGIKTLAVGTWKFFLGAVFCQFWPTSVLVVGWTYRVMQRSALRYWRARSPLPSDAVQAATEHEPLFLKHETWPHWFLQARATARGHNPQKRSRVRRLASAAAGSLILNARVGLAGIVNTSLVMLVPALLWQFGWYAGWDNSFNKGYEQYYTGIALSWIGIVLFLTAMLYLPMAQARHAVTGDWRAFYDFRTVWRVATVSPLRSLLLAAAFSVVALPINVLLIAAQGFDNSNTHRAMSDTEFLAWLNRYYFMVCAIGFAGYVFLRMLAARWYAAGMVALLASGRLSKEALAGDEARALALLGLDVAPTTLPLHPAIVVTLKVSRPVWKLALLAAAILVWFTFVAQIYVREFIVYHPYRGFMNQPLVQLPWLRYVPQALQERVQASKNR